MSGGGVVLTLGGDVVREFECAEQAALWLEIYGDPRRSDYAIALVVEFYRGPAVSA